jgi:nucleotide-binding universal stress UspA family protein
MYQNIVIGYDGSDRSEDALVLGCRLAAATHARVTIACAYAGRALAVRVGSAATGIDVAGEADAVLDHAMRQVPSGVEARTAKLPEASPARALNDLVEEAGADLLVLGSSSHGPIGRVLAGNMATRLLHGSPCAIAVAPAGYAEREAAPSGAIGVCFDDSPESELALGAAVELCLAMHARLRVLSVLGRPLHPYPSELGQSLPDFDPPTGLGADRITSALDHVRGAVEASGEAFTGSPAKVLAREAEAEALDLLVTGSRGYGPVGRVLLGGVSAKLMRIAPCPVLVVPRSAG